MADQNFRIRLILLVNGGGLSMTNNWKEKQRKGEDIVKTSLNLWVYQMFQFDSFVFLSFTIETRNHFGGSWAQLLYFIKLQKGQVAVEILWLKRYNWNNTENLLMNIREETIYDIPPPSTGTTALPLRVPAPSGGTSLIEVIRPLERTRNKLLSYKSSRE